MDGTLLGSEGKVSARNLAALDLARAGGAEIVIATGRRHCYAMQVLRGLGLQEDNLLISSNGTVIRTIGAKLLARRHIANSTARWLCEHAGEFRSTLLFTFDTVRPDGEDTRGALVCEGLEELHNSIGRWMKANEAYIEHVPSLADLFSSGAAEDRAPIQAMLCGRIDRMRAAEAHLLTHPAVSAVGAEAHAGAEITLHRTEYPARDLSIVDILPAGCSKASALLNLMESRGLGAADILAIGDNWNDLPMLRLAGHAVLMGNAPPELKTLARESGWALAPTHDEDGVAVALECIFGANRLGTPVVPEWGEQAGTGSGERGELSVDTPSRW